MSSNENQSEMISQFMGVTGADEDRAKFYLESSAWELQVAIAAFFDNDDTPMEEESFRPPIPEPVEEDLPPSAPAGTSSGISHSTGPVKQPKKPSSRFATIGDLRDEQPEDEDSGEEGQRFYAGGADHGSGQQVVGPRKKKNTDSIVKDLFKSAKEHGAEEISPGSAAPGSSSQSSFVFRGAAYRLGEVPTDSTQPVPGTAGTLPIPKAKEQHVVLKLWKNGFSVDDGPLRDFRLPENERFLSSVRRGEIPMELIQNAAGGEVNLDLEDHRDEEYQKPKPQRKAFEGKGYMLGNLTPSVTGESSQPQTPATAASKTTSDTASSWDVDASQPVTTLQLRLGNGTRLTGKFNHSHTVGDIRRFIALSRPEFAATTYKLMTTFPNKVLEDDSQTLSEANLLNAVIVQRLT